MGQAIANVQQVITIQGVDNASDAVKKAQASLKGLEAQTNNVGAAADDAGKSFGDGAKGLAGTAAKGLKGLSKFAGDGAGELSSLGKEAKGVSLILGALPPQFALGALAVVGIAAGVYALAKSVSEGKAKLDLLGNSDTARLKDGLGLSVDSAIKLTQALDSLKDKTLKPTDALLAQVAKNATSMGKDGGDAALAFVKALEGGPEALKAFQAEFGKLRGLESDTTGLAKRLGLSADLLGLEKAQSAEQIKQGQIGEALNRINERSAELAKVELDAAHQRGVSQLAGQYVDKWNAQQNAAALENQAELIRRKIQLDRDDLGVIQDEAKARQQIANAQAALLGRADVLSAQAAATANKKQRASLEEQANTVRMLAATRELNAFDHLHGQNVDQGLQAERAGLQVKVLQGKAAQVQTQEAEKQARQQAAQAAQAARQALSEAQLRVVRAQADRDGVETEKERLNLLDRERDKSLADAGKIKGKGARHEAELAALEEYKTKRAALEREIAKKSEDLAIEAAVAVGNTERDKSRSVAESLRKQGKDLEADLVEKKQAEADYSQAVIKIYDDLARQVIEGGLAGADLANAEKAAEQKRIDAKQTQADKEVSIAEETAKRIKDTRQQSIDAATNALDSLAQALGNIGQGGNFAAAALGGSISAMTRGLKSLGQIADDDKAKLGKTVEAIGGAAAGVANSIISAQTARLESQIDIEEQGALKGAETEEERAAITEKYEKQKADARDAGQRQSAIVMAAVSAAQAIAYAFTPGMQWAAAGQGVAAAAFAAIAGGAAGSSYVPGAATAGQGGFNSGGTSGGTEGAGGTGTGTVTHYTFNGVFATQQQIGQALNSHIQSLKGTGSDRRKGV